MPYRLNNISVAQFQLSVRWFQIRFTAGTYMPQFGHRGKEGDPSCRIATQALKFLYIKLSLSLPGVWALSGHPSTGHTTEGMTRRKDIT